MSFLIFNFFNNYKTIPLIHSFIQSLANNKCQADIIQTGKYSSVKYNTHNIEYTFRKLFFNSLDPFVVLIRSLSILFRNQYSYLVAVDPVTIFPVLILGKIFRKKIIYISLEIYVKEDINNIYFKYYYYQQFFFLKHFDKIIIMDEKRMELLKSNSNIIDPNKKFLFLPNSTLKPKSSSEFFLHDKLRISHTKKIVLIAGDFGERSYTQELIRVSRRLPKGFVIVLHSRKNDDYFQNNDIESSCLRLSLESVDITDLDNLYNSAYIGLSLYKIAEKGIKANNVYHIGKSSGKLSCYLKMGVPVIMSKLPYFVYLEKTYGCGICINNPEEIPKSIEIIAGDYRTYKKNAIQCFLSELEFEKAFALVINNLIH